MLNKVCFPRFQVRKWVHQDVYCHPACLNYIKCIIWNVMWMKHKMESRLPRKITNKTNQLPSPPTKFHQWFEWMNSFDCYRVYSKISLVQTLVNLRGDKFSIITLASLDLGDLHFLYFALASPWASFVWIM